MRRGILVWIVSVNLECSCITHNVSPIRWQAAQHRTVGRRCCYVDLLLAIACLDGYQTWSEHLAEVIACIVIQLLPSSAHTTCRLPPEKGAVPKRAVL